MAAGANGKSVWKIFGSPLQMKKHYTSPEILLVLILKILKFHVEKKSKYQFLANSIFYSNYNYHELHYQWTFLPFYKSSQWLKNGISNEKECWLQNSFWWVIRGFWHLIIISYAWFFSAQHNNVCFKRESWGWVVCNTYWNIWWLGELLLQ